MKDSNSPKGSGTTGPFVFTPYNIACTVEVWSMKNEEVYMFLGLYFQIPAFVFYALIWPFHDLKLYFAAVCAFILCVYVCFQNLQILSSDMLFRDVKIKSCLSVLVCFLFSFAPDFISSLSGCSIASYTVRTF